ncbi:sulfite reductase flavoprotein subunit alpha [Sphingomonas sp. Leaf21]|uniref:sulfite reductase flavoprotein subunit alpha n=1 Tax=Sphingomonas sp. Leaf21 TaxID=2876550 RepID=UPI001E4F194F|nr:sulfite reductase flavoprotein subunit alpha [Sphingomonas sp. Leaf21]
MISTRSVLFQIHWFLGITAGLVLAVMAVTGALISFEPEILAATNPGIVTVAPGRGAPLAAPALIARISAQHPDTRISRLVVESDPTRAAFVTYALGDAKKRLRGYVDPTSGRILGEPRGSGFFETVENLHRWLALPGKGNGFGRQITGFAALSLIYFALSGLYLRWPRKPLDWRNWFVLDLRMTGRNLYRALHAVIGGWVLIFYLISAGTGLWWSYDWYRTGVRHLLSSEQASHGPREGGKRRRGADDDAPVDLAATWRSFERATANRAYERVTATVRDGSVQFRAKLPDGRHDRVSDELSIDAATARVTADQPYAQRPLGDDIVTSVYEIHRGAYFGLAGRIVMTLTSLTMPLFTITGFLLYFARRRRKAALGAVPTDIAPVPAGTATTLVAYASQTGSAERIARLTAQAMPGAAALPIAALTPMQLARVDRLFVVASTYGEGEPPDAARGFARIMARAPDDFSHLSYAVLALGDREYPDFCAFGHRIDQWLHSGGAQRLFDVIEQDGEDADAQRLWQQQLASLGARTDQPDWAPAPMAEWRLVERRLLNPGSSGGETWHIALEPVEPPADWAAGDILEILPRQDVRRVEAFLAATGLTDTPDLRGRLMDSILPVGAGPGFDAATLRPLAHREYSIASIPVTGRAELIVRLAMAEDGLPGLGSGWLCQGAAIGSVVRARVHRNAAFHAPADPATPMLLIGNGTGLAGLLAHLRARAASGGGPVWLFWGERHPDHDDYHRAERQALLDSGTLSGMATAWSRLGHGPRYVQHVLADSAETIRDAVAAGAAIHVCGSLKGMAGDVHRLLTDILGDEVLEDLAASGRYARDIY